MKLSNKRFCRYIVASLLLAISISCCFSNKAFAKTNTYYGDYGITGGQVCYATRVKYTYDTVNGKSVTSKKSEYKTKASYTCSKTKKQGTHYSLSRAEINSYSVSINASIPLDILKSVVPERAASLIGGSISVGVTKTNSETITCAGDGYLYKKGDVAHLQVRDITETEVRTLKCQKQQQNINGKWKNVGNSYTKKITIVNKYPDHRIKEVLK